MGYLPCIVSASEDRQNNFPRGRIQTCFYTLGTPRKSVSIILKFLKYSLEISGQKCVSDIQVVSKKAGKKRRPVKGIAFQIQPSSLF